MDPQTIAMIAIAIVVILLSLTVHEFSHGWVAAKLGDPTAKLSGRLSLNPIAHIDPIGTIALPVLMAIMHGPIFGWAKPVPINPLYFRRDITMRKGMLLVAAAGPVSNILLATVGTVALGVAIRTGLIMPGSHGYVYEFFYYFIFINLLLAFFNFIPIPPLDGSKILYGLLPENMARKYAEVERYGFILLILIIATPIGTMLLSPVAHIFGWFLNLSGIIGGV